MAGSNNSRTVADIRSEIENEREELAGAAESLRESLSEATDVRAKLAANLAAAAIGALGLGFLLAGGLGATARLIFARGRESETKPQVGRFRLVNRD